MTTARPVPAGSPARIRERQDQPEHLQRLLAYSHLYRIAQRWHRARAFGTFLATVAPIISLLFPSTSDILAAVGAGWLVAGRTVLSWLEEQQSCAVRVQELYDTRLFKLPWNTALARREPAPEDVVAAAAAHPGRQPIPRLVQHRPRRHSLARRRPALPAESAVWSRRDHRAYGTAILITGIAWFALGLPSRSPATSASPTT